MDRKLVWTEKASSDIEAIVRYIARRDPCAAARVGVSASTIALRFSLGILKPERCLTSFARVVGESSSSDDGKSFTRFVTAPSLSVEFGRQRWAKPIWKRR